LLDDAVARHRESDVSGDPQRAQRFSVRVPMRYRSVGEAHWRDGRIENISRTGVLFQTEQVLPPDTPLEMSFVLPLGGAAPGVFCRGRVVRTVPRNGGGVPPALAATIATYRFVRSVAVA
jgi:hypothetical protein